MAGLVLFAGTGTALAQQSSQATAELRDANGQVVGSATMTQESGGVRVVVQARNMPPGPHGIHLHERGQCDPPGFMSAGDHFNPTGRQHGLQNPSGPHVADLPNLEIAANGTGQLTYLNNLVTPGSGNSNLLDADGSALVVHANADDQVTDPSGNSGGRIACGLVARSAAAGQPVPVQAPSALPRTGDASVVFGQTVPVAAAGVAMLLTGVAIRRRRC